METIIPADYNLFATEKRKRVDILQEHLTQDLSDGKRRQPDNFFRPWLGTEQSNDAPKSSATSTPIPAASIYHANMVRPSQPRERSPKEQRRRDRNTLACLLSRRARQKQEAYIAQQYEQYRAQHLANLEQQVRYKLYYRQLLQQAVFQQGGMAPGTPELPQHQQQFLQEMSLSQQLLLFGVPY